MNTSGAKTLVSPFPSKMVSWRMGAINKEALRAQAFPYLERHVIETRLDDVMGPGCWKTSFEFIQPGTKIDAIICTLSLKFDGEWVGRSDGVSLTESGASNSNDNMDVIKTGITNAFKRAAACWGIGRYIYEFSAPVADIEYRGQYAKFKQTPRMPDWALPIEEQGLGLPQGSAPEQFDTASSDQAGTGASANVGKVYLAVSIKEKDAAKALGAKWDAEARKWFVLSSVSNMAEFAKWIPSDTPVTSEATPVSVEAPPVPTPVSELVTPVIPEVNAPSEPAPELATSSPELSDLSSLPEKERTMVETLLGKLKSTPKVVVNYLQGKGKDVISDAGKAIIRQELAKLDPALLA